MKKFLRTIVLILLIFCFSRQVYANVNETEYLRQGDAFLKQAQSGAYPEFSLAYLKKAQYYYYVASKNTPPSIEALIGLGRVYILQNKMESAKNALFKAYSLDPYNADANFYFAEFYYMNDDFQLALKYYEKSRDLGYKDSSKNLEMINKCMSKLGANQTTEESE